MEPFSAIHAKALGISPKAAGVKGLPWKKSGMTTFHPQFLAKISQNCLVLSLLKGKRLEIGFKTIHQIILTGNQRYRKRRRQPWWHPWDRRCKRRGYRW